MHLTGFRYLKSGRYSVLIAFWFALSARKDCKMVTTFLKFREGLETEKVLTKQFCTFTSIAAPMHLRMITHLEEKRPEGPCPPGSANCIPQISPTDLVNLRY